MRFLSVLLILAGLAIAFALPLYQTDFAGEAVKTVEVFDRTLGRTLRVGLEPEGAAAAPAVTPAR